jgi:hypothetical protein
MQCNECRMLVPLGQTEFTFKRGLMMVYNTRNYRVFGLWSSSGILKKTAFRETGSVSVLRGRDRGGGTHQSRCLPLHLKKGIYPVSETLCFFLEYLTMDRAQKPNNSETEFNLPYAVKFYSHQNLFSRKKEWKASDD